MATELTWASDVNRAVASAASAAEQSKWEVWYLLASLCGNSNLAFNGNAGVWTVVRTCGSTDGTSGTLTADTTDRLHLGSGAYTSNDWVFGANASAGRSWALLQSPSALGSYYMIVDFQNATSGKCDIWFGKTLSANGSTTAVPTFSDGWSYAAQFNNNSIANTHRCHLMLSTRGDFWWYEGYDTNAGLYSVLGVSKLASTHSADNYTTVSFYVGANNPNSSSLGFQAAINAGTLGGSSNAIIKGRNFSGSTASNAIVAIFPGYSSGALSNIITGTANTGTNASDSTYNGFVVWLIDVTATELKGRVADFLWASGTPAQASNAPNASPYEYIKVGHCWTPWASSSALIL